MFLRVVLALSWVGLVAGIFGGIQVQPGELPYNALISIRDTADRNVIYHSGSILNDRWILTAAHAVFADRNRLVAFGVTVGKYDMLQADQTEQTRGVKVVICHPEYNDAIVGMHDLALLRLLAPVSLNDFVKPVALERSTEYPSVWVGTVSGYGMVLSSGNSASFLSKLSVNLLSRAVCSSGQDFWNDGLICTDPGTCGGDSGAPLVERRGDFWIQIGLVSNGSQCVFYGSPVYYTFVSRYVGWINETIWQFEDDNDDDAAIRPSCSVLVVVLVSIWFWVLRS
ncbi:coagulation factor IX-like [Uranotaenia lowii]|uniref:coagulation factor IX-like n=1 Tax=Uranotaenia lowii TaxID=190385 RepID=UPI002478A6D2|nr:coagulation factor IX-like [Uranotaenia lowii]